MPSVIRNVPESQLRELVVNASTFSEVLIALNLRTEGGNVKTLRKILDELKISYSHIKTGRDSNKGRSVLNKTGKPLQEHLTENSSISRTNLKKRLIRENVLNNHCSECGLASEWNGKKLVLVLDHINGIHNDNRINNLRLLCPNCNSQTDTFAGKNLRRKGV